MNRRRFTLLISLLVLMGLGVFALRADHLVTAAADLTPKEARKIIATMAGIELPSDAVRIKEISPMGNSAVVVAQVETAFRFSKTDGGKWRVAEIRLGDRKWESVDLLIRALNSEKTARARSEMETVATALKSFQRERGFYVAADTMTALIDHLNPNYLTTIIRVDPWQQPYQYEGNRSSFTLRSPGADGKPNTADDIVITQGAG